jgi:hypothetical protein
MKKEQIIEELKNRGVGIYISGECISMYEYAKQNYKPWTFNLTSNKEKIDKFYFPDKDRSRISGDYFGIYPSLPLWENEFFSADGQLIEESELRISEVFGGTGWALISYNKV